jgi:hypothetical protein
VAAPDGGFAAGDRVATAMDGMGRQFEGGYAENTPVPAGQVLDLRAGLPWAMLGYLPDGVLTACGSRHTAPGAKSGKTLLIRRGTASVGLTGDPGLPGRAAGAGGIVKAHHEMEGTRPAAESWSRPEPPAAGDRISRLPAMT